MKVKSQLTKKLGGALFSSALAITTQGSSSLILGALGGIASGIASNYINDIPVHKLKKLLKESDPSELNHDLQKLVIKAVEWTIINIQIRYKKTGLSKAQLRDLNDFTENLVSQMKAMNHQLSEDELEIIRTIEKSDNDSVLFNYFGLQSIEFPEIHPENSYEAFFKKQFQSNLQLCFGELLKDDTNRAALIAYQRSIYQGLENGLDRIIEQNEQILKQVKDSTQKKIVEKENRQWCRVKEKVKEAPDHQVTPEFTAALDDLLLGVKKDTELLIDMTSDIKTELERVKSITLDIAVELRRNWIEKNKVWVLASISILLMIIVGFAMKLYSAPFQMNVSLEADSSINVHTEYPELSKEALVRFYFPEGTVDKEVTFSNEIILPKVSHELKDSYIRIQLMDPYWKFSSDSLKIQAGNRKLKIRPNEELSMIKGQVRSYLENQPIEGIEIKTASGLVATSGVNGNFKIRVPIELRKLEHTIIVNEQLGYAFQEKEYYPGLEIVLRLEKLSK